PEASAMLRRLTLAAMCTSAVVLGLPLLLSNAPSGSTAFAASKGGSAKGGGSPKGGGGAKSPGAKGPSGLTIRVKPGIDRDDDTGKGAKKSSGPKPPQSNGQSRPKGKGSPARKK